MLINVKINRVVYGVPYPDVLGVQLLREAGVCVDKFEEVK
jgi:deoxycytidylate deaminase